MKIKTKILFITILSTMLLMLAGCSSGSTIDTQMSMNSDGSGVRHMSVAIANSVFDEYFNGTTDDVDNLIMANCPDCISWEHINEDDADIYNFDIEFSSVDDYKQKIQSLIDDATTDITISNSVWANGIYANESFTSKDLLGWLSNAIVESGLVSSSNSDMIFSEGYTTFLFNNNEFNTDSYIYIDEVTYVSLSDIYILTELEEDNLFDRHYIFDIEKDGYNDNKEQITEFMNSITPSNAEVNCIEKDNYVTYDIYVADASDENLSEMDKTICGNDETYFNCPDQEWEYSPFSFEKYYYENLNFSNYIVSGKTETSIHYGIKGKDELDFYNISLLDFDSENYIEEYPEYLLVDEINYYEGNDILTGFVSQVKNRVNTIDISMKKNISGWTRITKFALDASLSDEQVNQINARLSDLLTCNTIENEVAEQVEDEFKIEGNTESAVDEFAVEGDYTSIASDIGTEGDIESIEDQITSVDEAELIGENENKQSNCKVEISIENSEDLGSVITITQKGTLNEIKNNTLLFDETCTLDYANDQNFTKINKKEVYEENINYGLFTYYTTDNFTLNYSLDMGTMRKNSYGDVLGEDLKVKNGKLNLSNNYTRTEIIYAGNYFDGRSIIFWLLICLSVVNIIIWCIKIGYIQMLFNKFKNFNKNRIVISTKATNKFCGKCGAQIETTNIKFCPKCGEKIQ